MKKTILVLSLASCAFILNAFAEEYYGIGESNTFRLDARYVESSWMDGATVHDGGMLMGDETWAAANVHVVYGTVVVQTNVTLSIESGAVVKFVGGGLLSLGSCIASGVTFTDIADGADMTNASIPVPSYVLNGNIVTDGSTVVKFCREGDAFSAGGESNVFALHTREVEDSWLYGAVVHDGGMLAGNEIWEVGKIHIVYGAIVVPTNITLTIESGAIVKFIGGGIHALGTCIAKGALFTDVADGIGEGTIPVPSYMLDGNIEADSATVVKFSREGGAFSSSGESNVFALNTRNIESSWLDGVVIHDGGVLKCDETWGTGSIHVVYGTITVPDNATLTIESGVVVKFVGGGLYALGTCIANGVTFTDIADGGTHAISSSLPMPSYVLEGDFVTDDATRFKFAKMGDAFAQAGQSDVFALDSTEYEYRFARDEESITFSSAWANGANVKVSVAKSGNVVDTLVDENGLVDGIVSWARPQNAGFYELRHESGDETLTAIFAVADGVLHDGVITSDETWANGMVHVVNENVTIATGTTLTIEAGAVVKFLDGTTLTVEAGGACIAEGVTFTSIADDSIGGDTLGDGGATVPVENGYAIIGVVRDDLATVYRYGVQSYSGTLTRNDEWRMEKTYVIDGTLTVADGVTLTIPVGTVVKFTEGSELKVTNGGACSAEGVIFTHIADDSVGGDTMGDGDATKPEYGKYTVDVSVLDNDATEYRYSAPITTSGTIYGNVVWRARQVYHVTGNLTLASGATLTIAPGSVIKFNPNVSFTVNSGATLNAQGTRSSPVVLTSFKDDAHGGDTNGDGNNSLAQGGDWGTLSVSGVANFDYTTIQYGGSDILRLNSNGTINFNNSEIAHAYEYCVDLEGGAWNMRNSVFRDFYTAFRHWSTTFSCVNSVFYDCSYISNNGGQSFVNCIFERYSLGLCWWTDDCSYRNCVFWNPADDSGSPQSCVHAGSNGSIWADPKFANAEKGDFRLKADSPCVDAGAGMVAPDKDYYNQPRQTIQSVTPTGTPNAKGVYADIGIYEVQPRNAGADVDLEVKAVMVPETMTVGELVTVAWREANIGSVDTDGKWYDKVELVSANGAVATLGMVPVVGIPAGGEKTITEASFRVPAVAEGACTIRVTANYNRDIYEGSLTANNVGLSDWATVSLPTVATNDFTRITLAEGASTALKIPYGSGISAIRVHGGQNVAVFAGAGYVPMDLHYDVAAVALADGSYLLVLPKSVAETDFYMTLQNGSTSSESIQLETLTETISMLGVSPSEMSNAGIGHLTIHGIGMDRVTEVKLQGPSTRVASEVMVVSPGELTATIDMANAMEGNYTVVLETEDGGTIRATKTISVYKPKLGPKLEAWLEMPSSVRRGRIYTGRVHYCNSGDADMEAPLLALEVSGAQIRLPGEADWQKETLYVMGVSGGYPAGVLKAGEETSLIVEIMTGDSPSFSLRTEHDETEAWEARREAISSAATRVNLRGRPVIRWGRLEQYATAFTAGTNSQAICGLLLNESDGVPLSGARIVALAEDGTAFSGDTVDDSGRFILDGIQGPTNVLLVVESGACVHTRWVGVPEQGDVLDITLTGMRGYDVNVDFLGLDGLENVTTGIVELVHVGTGLRTPAVVSGGNATIQVYCSGEYTASAVVGKGQEIAKSFFIGVEDTSVSLTFDFSEGGSVSGIVADTKGGIVADAVVTIQSESDSSYTRTVVTDENGEWKAECLPAGNYVAVASGSKSGSAETVAFSVLDKAETPGLRLGVVTYGSSLSVSVENAPEGGSALFVANTGEHSDSVKIAADGTFRIDGIPEGVGTIRIYDAKGKIVAIKSDTLIKTGENTRTIVVNDEKAVFVGTANDEDGNPVAVDWMLLPPNSDGMRVAASEVDENGQIAFEVPKADYWGQASAPGFISEAFHVRIDRDKSVKVIMKRGGYVGHVFPDGIEEADATVAFRTASASAAAARDDHLWIAGPLAANESAIGFVVHATGAYLTEETTIVAGTTGIVARADAVRPLDIRFGDSTEVAYVQLELKSGVGFTATFAVSENRVMLTEFPEIETDVRAYSADGSLVASSMITPTARNAVIGTDAIMTVAGSVTGCKPGQCAGGMVSFCTGDGVTLSSVALSANGTFRSAGVPVRFERVWIVLADGTSVFFDKSEAIALGWQLPLPEGLGEVNYQFNDKDGTPLAGLPIVVSFDDGFRTTAKTDSNGRVSVKHKTNGHVTVRAQNSTDSSPPLTPVLPSVCSNCGQHPCICWVGEPCSVCGSDPCICRIEQKEIQVDNETIEKKTVPDPVNLPPLKKVEVNEVHYHDWTMSEALWYDPLVARYNELVEMVAQIKMSPPPRVCPDTECKYCEARFGAYNRAVWNRYRQYRSAEVKMINFVGDELSELQRISRTLHRQQTVGVCKNVVVVIISVAAEVYSLGGATPAVAAFVASTTGNYWEESLEVSAGGQSSFDPVGTYYNVSLDGLGIQEALDNDYRIIRANAQNALTRIGNGRREYVNPKISGVAGNVATGVGIVVDAVSQTIRWRNHDDMMNYRIRAMDHNLAQFSALLAMTASAASTPYKICENRCWVRHQFGESCDCDEESCPMLVRASSTRGPDSSSPSIPSSSDPNEIVGPAGVGEERLVKPGETMDYTIYFENMTNATAAAQDIYVTLPKDAGLDWSTFELGEVVFGDNIDNALSGAYDGESSYAIPGTNWSVRTVVTHTADAVKWHLRIIDPTTPDNYPSDAYAGFLPPNDETGRGEGHLRFRVKVKDGAVVGSRINASATIVFDYNDPITTDPAWWNTVGQEIGVTIGDNEDGGLTHLFVGAPYGNALPEKPAKEKTGYTFGGWYTGPNGTGRRVTAQSLVEAGDGTLYAHWLACAYNVHFDANGGEGQMSDQPFEFDKEAELDANAFEFKGYSFGGWATNETGEAVYADCAVVSNLTAESGGVVNLYATWTVNSYTVAFDANGGEGGWSSNMVYGTAIAAPTVTHEGYTFAGWQPVLLGTVPASDVTFTAQWTVNSYTVAFDANGGEGGWSSNMVYGTAIAAPTVTREGYTFAGWQPALLGTVPASDVTFTAQWTVNSYTVAFDANGGEGGWSSNMVYGTAIAAPTVTREGYTFAGWQPALLGTVPASNVTFTAQWNINQYTVNIDLGGGTGDTGATLAYGMHVGDVKLPTKVGYAFDGWWTAAEGGEQIPGDTLITGELSLYARWTANAYKVRFNANGGTGTMADQAFVYGTAQKLSANAFKQGIYAFVGWATKPDGEVVYADGQLVENLTASANGVVTLYAVWTMDRPMLFTDVTEAAPQTAASVYDGYLYNKSTGALAGTIQVKVGKPGKDGKAAVKATVIGLDGKKKSLKAVEKGKALIENDGTTTVELVGGDACEVKIGAKGMSGTYGSYDIDGALNVFTSKDAADKATAATVLGKWQGVVNVAWRSDATERLAGDGSPYHTLSVTIANKGKAKVAGTLADGTKVSASSQLLVGDEWCCVPVLEPKKSHLAFVLWLPADATGRVPPMVVGLENAIVGKPGTLKAGAEFRMNEVLGDAKYADYLPNGVPVTGGTKWVLPKAGKVQLAKDGLVDATKLLENPSALKLTYTAKTGSFKGSFKAYSDVRGKPKGVTVNVTGVLVDGIGYGAATIKKIGSVPVTISDR